jgi:glucan 1,3-beta-glucosidase
MIQSRCSLLRVSAMALLLSLSLTRLAVAQQPVRLYGINYNNRQGPDWDPNRCKSYSQVLQDLTALSGLSNRVRIVSLSDCNQGPFVMNATKALGMQVMLGLWVSNVTSVVASEISVLQSLIQSGQVTASNVVGVTVGSEAVYRKDVTADMAVNYLAQVKQIMVKAGLSTIPVSICDVDDTYVQYPQLFGGDQVVVNCKLLQLLLFVALSYCTIGRCYDSPSRRLFLPNHLTLIFSPAS